MLGGLRATIISPESPELSTLPNIRHWEIVKRTNTVPVWPGATLMRHDGRGHHKSWRRLQLHTFLHVRLPRDPFSFFASTGGEIKSVCPTPIKAVPPSAGQSSSRPGQPAGRLPSPELPASQSTGRPAGEPAAAGPARAPAPGPRASPGPGLGLRVQDPELGLGDGRRGGGRPRALGLVTGHWAVGVGPGPRAAGPSLRLGHRSHGIVGLASRHRAGPGLLPGMRIPVALLAGMRIQS